MRRTVHELRNNQRALAALKGRPAPGRIRIQIRKSFSLRVICAADFPHRVVKFENLQHDILQRKLYTDMTPQNLFAGDFRVTEGFEEQFKEIAREHGFAASEVYSCD
jgi:hypothetical protein